MAADNNGAKTDVIVKLVLVFFISLLSFSIGTFVGKKFSDNQYKISQLEPKAGEHDQVHDQEHDREVASVHPDSTEVKPKDALSDDEIKKLAEEFVSDDEGKKTTAHDDTHATPAPAASTQESHDKKEVVAPTHAEATPQTTEVSTRAVAGQTTTNRIPQSLPKELSSSAIGKYTVQVASYPTEDEAQKVAGDLKEKGFSSFYVSAKIKDKKTNSEKTWYRVSVGLFNTQKEAELYKTDLLSRAKVSSAIIQKVTE